MLQKYVMIIFNVYGTFQSIMKIYQCIYLDENKRFKCSIFNKPLDNSTNINKKLF